MFRGVSRISRENPEILERIKIFASDLSGFDFRSVSLKIRDILKSEGSYFARAKRLLHFFAYESPMVGVPLENGTYELVICANVVPCIAESIMRFVALYFGINIYEVTNAGDMEQKITMRVFEHLLREASRLLVPGGIFAFVGAYGSAPIDGPIKNFLPNGAKYSSLRIPDEFKVDCKESRATRLAEVFYEEGLILRKDG